MTVQERLRMNLSDIKNQYDSGVSLREISKKYDCNSGSVWLILKEYNYLRESKKINRTSDYEDEIIDMFNAGVPINDISKKINITQPPIYKFLEKKGFQTNRFAKDRKESVSLDSLEEKVVELYEHGYNHTEIAKMIGCHNSSVGDLLKKLGVPTRKSSNAKYSVNDTYFSKIDTQEKAYILGWMYSDGNVTERGKFRIQIQSSDDYILCWIKQEIGYTGPLYNVPPRKNFPNRKNQTCLSINRKPMADDLIRLGCIPNKSLILKFPTEDIVPKELMPHFLRGFFDGDGSLWEKSVCITSTDDFINDMNEYLIKNIGIDGGKSYYRYKNKNTVSYKLRKEDSKKFLDWIYKDSKVHLNRKYSLYTELSV